MPLSFSRDTMKALRHLLSSLPIFSCIDVFYASIAPLAVKRFHTLSLNRNTATWGEAKKDDRWLLLGSKVTMELYDKVHKLRMEVLEEGGEKACDHTNKEECTHHEGIRPFIAKHTAAKDMLVVVWAYLEGRDIPKSVSAQVRTVALSPMLCFPLLSLYGSLFARHTANREPNILYPFPPKLSRVRREKRRCCDSESRTLRSSTDTITWDWIPLLR